MDGGYSVGQGGPALGQGGPATVILVEDNVDMRQSLVWLFEASGYLVEAYASGQELLAAYNPEKPGCLVLDLRLPDMNGLELQSQLVKRGGRHPFVVVSAHGSIPTAVDAMREGAVDFIPKPFEHRYLLTQVEKAISIDAHNRARRRQNALVRRRLDSLSPREREVMEKVIAGKASKEIATDLGISPKTVEVHRANLVRKMHAGSVAQLVRMVTLVEDTKPGPTIANGDCP